MFERLARPSAACRFCALGEIEEKDFSRAVRLEIQLGLGIDRSAIASF
jgi:hypothetical protein